jgi:hypothetical protein
MKFRKSRVYPASRSASPLRRSISKRTFLASYSEDVVMELQPDAEADLAARVGTRSLLQNLQKAYTALMKLKNATFLALVGMTLVTILLVAGFIGDVFAIVRGLIPAVRVLTSFIYAFAGLSIVVFLYAFHKSQS